jgi:MYXO-CTERM domain-containing protein
MKKHLLVGLALGAAVLIGHEPAAEACGGCFIPRETPSVVTDHRMIFSISNDQSTLYDQIKYSGKPESFAWVLPFAGDIEVGTSSDELFAALDLQTQTQIFAPRSPCGFPPICEYSSSSGSAAGLAGSSSGNLSGVVVLHNEVVGPYETVQLEATDPQALDKWLGDHHYDIPETVKPVLAAYQAEHFNFLAIKLVPGEQVQAMKPIRVTTKGSNVALPLRMVSAGTGATVGITLWVVAEGRYEPSNFGSFLVRAEDLTWDWATNSSDYTKLRADRTATGQGKVWEVESVTRSLRTSIVSTIGSSFSGYDAETTDAGVVTKTPAEAFNADIDTLFAGIPAGSERITRLRADLAHDALDRDLTLKAATSQEDVARTRTVTKSVNAPVCPVYPPCSSRSGDGSASQGANGASPSNDDDGCQTSPGGTSLPWLGAFVAAALMVLARSRKEKR